MERSFEIINGIGRDYRKFRASGKQLTVRLRPPSSSESNDPVNCFLASVNALFEYALRNAGDSDMVGVTIRNEENQGHKPIEISFRRRDQIEDILFDGQTDSTRRIMI